MDISLGFMLEDEHGVRAKSDEPGSPRAGGWFNEAAYGSPVWFFFALEVANISSAGLAMRTDKNISSSQERFTIDDFYFSWKAKRSNDVKGLCPENHNAIISP